MERNNIYDSSREALKPQKAHEGISAEHHQVGSPSGPSDNGSAGSVGEHFVRNSLYGTVPAPEGNSITSFNSVGEHMVSNSLYSIPSTKENIDSISTSSVGVNGVNVEGLVSGDLSTHAYEVVPSAEYEEVCTKT